MKIIFDYVKEENGEWGVKIKSSDLLVLEEKDILVATNLLKYIDAYNPDWQKKKTYVPEDVTINTETDVELIKWLNERIESVNALAKGLVENGRPTSANCSICKAAAFMEVKEHIENALKSTCKSAESTEPVKCEHCDKEIFYKEEYGTWLHKGIKPYLCCCYLKTSTMAEPRTEGYHDADEFYRDDEGVNVDLPDTDFKIEELFQFMNEAKYWMKRHDENTGIAGRLDIIDKNNFWHHTLVDLNDDESLTLSDKFVDAIRKQVKGAEIGNTLELYNQNGWLHVLAQVVGEDHGHLVISDKFAEAIENALGERNEKKRLNGESVISDVIIDVIKEKLNLNNRITLKDSKGINHDLVFMSDKDDGEFVLTSKFMDAIVNYSKPRRIIR